MDSDKSAWSAFEIRGVNSIYYKASQRTFLRLLRETTVENFLFYFAFTCFSLAEILNTTAFVVVLPQLGFICRALLYCSAGTLLLRLAILRATENQWATVLAIAALAAFLGMLHGLQYPFWIFLFVVSGRDVDLKIIAKITLILTSTLTLLTIFACYVGFLENYTMVATDTRAVRNSLGFLHPNRLGQRIAEICIAYWYLHVDNRKGRVIALCALSLTYVYLVTNSRSSCIVFVILIVVTLAYPLFGRFPRFSVLGCSVIVAVIAAGSLFLMAEYNPLNTVMAGINELVTGRLYLMNASYIYAPPSLFGNDYSNAPIMGYTLASNAEYRFVVDNAYAHLILQYGVAATILFFILIVIVYGHHYHERRFSGALLGLTLLLVVGFVENFTLDIQYNYFLLLISNVIFCKKLTSKQIEQ